MKEMNCNCEEHGHDHLHDGDCCEIDEIELIDEEGNVITFQLEEWFEYNDKVYAVLVDGEEALLFESIEEDGELSFVTPSEEEFDEVKAYYEELE